MVLSGVSKTLEILLSAPVTTSPVQWSASWNDSFTGLGENDGTISNATAKQMVPAPYHAPFSRDVTQLTIVNKDTVPATVSVRINNAGVFTTVFSFTLPVGGNASFGAQSTVVVDSTGVAVGSATSANQVTEIGLLGSAAKESGGNLAAIAAQTTGLTLESGNAKTIAYYTQTQQELLYLILAELKVLSLLFNEMSAPHQLDLDALRSNVNEIYRR